VTTKLLAVDDSKTLRKVLEITFAGEDFQTELAGSPDEALQKLRVNRPAIVLLDTFLAGASGYDLCQQIKGEAPATRVILLSSKHRPYDQTRGAQVGADDYIDKPFDTQKLIEKVRALLVGERPQAPPPQAAPAQPHPPQAPPPQAPPPQVSVPQAPPPQVGQPGLAPRQAPRPTVSAVPQRPASPPVSASPAVPASRPASPSPQVGARPMAPAPTFGAGARQPAPVAPPASAPAAPPAAPAAAPQAASAPRVAAAVAAAGADLTGQLQELGLDANQVQGVLALSREVVERVVWKVVPVLAETLIKEEIARLTAE